MQKISKMKLKIKKFYAQKIIFFKSRKNVSVIEPYSKGSFM